MIEEQWRMTRQEWLESTSPGRMMYFVIYATLIEDGYTVSRLFSAACCRRIFHLIGDARSKAAVEFAERFADRCLSDMELFDAVAQAAEEIRWPTSFAGSE